MADLLNEIETFLARTGMGESAFGKRVENSDIVKRLRAGRDVRTRTADKVLRFILEHAANDPDESRQDQGDLTKSG